MTVINVYRSSLTFSSIINSFLKVIVWMHLLPTSGSFVGDPSGDYCGGGLLVTKKMYHFVNKNKMMTATHVAFGSFKEVPTASLVLQLPTNTTTVKQKKIIVESFFVEKEEEEEEIANHRRNGEEEEEIYRGVEDLMHYTNSTTGNRLFVTVEDTFGLFRPILPIHYNRNISDSIWLFDDKEEVPLMNTLPFAAILDGIAAKLFHSIEIFVKWNDESFVILIQNVKVLGHSGGIAVRELFDHAGFLVDRIADSFLSPVREKLHAFINEYDPAWYQFYILHHCMATEFGPLLFAFIVSFGSIYFFRQRKQFQSLKSLGRGIISLHRCPASRKEEPSFFNHLPQRQIVVSSSRRSYKIHHEFLPFELHDMCIDLSYDRYEHAIWLQEEYPDREEYMSARNLFREAEFFENAKGACADNCGLFIEPIMEEEEEDAVLDDVGNVVLDAGSARVGDFLNHDDDEWCDALNKVEDCYVEEESIDTVTMNIDSTSSTVVVPVGDTTTGNPDNQKRVCGSTSQIEVVGTFTTDAASKQPTVEPTTKSTPLGSGFYVDTKGRERRFSHRIMAKTIVLVAKNK